MRVVGGACYDAGVLYRSPAVDDGGDSHGSAAVMSVGGEGTCDVEAFLGHMVGE